MLVLLLNQIMSECEITQCIRLELHKVANLESMIYHLQSIQVDLGLVAKSLRVQE